MSRITGTSSSDCLGSYPMRVVLLFCRDAVGVFYSPSRLGKSHLLLTVLKKVLFDPEIGPYHVLPLRVRVDLETMSIKDYSIFPKAPLTGASSSDCLRSYPEHTLFGVLPLCRVAFSVFYSPTRVSRGQGSGESPFDALLFGLLWLKGLYNIS